MAGVPGERAAAPLAAFADLEAAWSRSAARHLPERAEGSIWRATGAGRDGLPAQGWKLHVSATVLTATSVLDTVAPLLAGYGVHYKAPVSLLELKRLNCGLFYGYSQVGKFITVYPRTGREAVDLSRILDGATKGLRAPAVPFEERVTTDSVVFRRYGAFITTPGEPGAPPTVVAPNGERVPDLRDRNPDWAERPVGFERVSTRSSPQGPLAETYRVFEALSQRGKGGVYKALDLTTRPARLCVVKEGRALGEIDWDRVDGRARVSRDAAVLRDLRRRGVPVPEVLAEFPAGGHRYIVVEWIEGESLAQVLAPDRDRLSLARALSFARQAAQIAAAVHAAGWVWRDLKAANFMVAPDATLRPIDFEGAVRPLDGAASAWGTAGYIPPEWTETKTPSATQDCFALGVLLHQLFTNRAVAPGDIPPVETMRPDVPAAVRQLIGALTAVRPENRPGAAQACAALARG